MGRVYRVFDRETKSKIALKLIKPEIAFDQKTVERFRNELKVARNLSHKNICRMYDLNREASNYYITMEYVHGEDLRKLLAKMGQFSAGQAISVAKQVCDELAEAHRLGVIHRDLKPSNIMIDNEGTIRIMDFGIARSVKTEGITDTGVMIGTPEYMSPEQAEGKEADQRSDIYSLGSKEKNEMDFFISRIWSLDGSHSVRSAAFRFLRQYKPRFLPPKRLKLLEELRQVLHSRLGIRLSKAG